MHKFGSNYQAKFIYFSLLSLDKEIEDSKSLISLCLDKEEKAQLILRFLLSQLDINPFEVPDLKIHLWGKKAGDLTTYYYMNTLQNQKMLELTLSHPVCDVLS